MYEDNESSNIWIAFILSIVLITIGLLLFLSLFNPSLWVFGSLPSPTTIEIWGIIGCTLLVVTAPLGLPLIVLGVINIVLDLFAYFEVRATVDLRQGQIEPVGRPMAGLGIQHDDLPRMAPIHERFDPMEGYRHNFYAPVNMHARPARPAVEIVDKTMKAIESDIEEARAKGDSEVDLTDRLQGPISYERMRDPVLAEDGFTYERSEIAEWLARSNKSPLTREVMGARLQPNAKMKALVDRFEGEEEVKLAVEQAGVVLGV